MSYYTFKNFKLLSDDEKRLVWEWRNHDEIRKWMYNQDVISFDKHISFVESLKTDNTKQYWIVRRKDEYAGVTSIVNYDKYAGEMGYYISPYLHRKNIGIEYYYYFLEFLFETLKLQEVYGYTVVCNSKANSINRFFKSESEIIQKDIHGEKVNFFFIQIGKSKWVDEIKNDSKIQQILNIIKRM